MNEEKNKKPVGKQKKYATVHNPTINAVLKALYSFASEEQALQHIDKLKENFVTSKQSKTPNTALIWVGGYELTEEEKEQGSTGNFALISYKKSGDRYKLYATKISSDPAHQPHRKRPKKEHPDWGHPILRDIRKGRLFESMEQAFAELMRLHEEFPNISIPSDNGLLIILYEKVEGEKLPVQKYKFKIEITPAGEYFIHYRRNVKPKKTAYKRNQESENKGYFSAVVNLRRKQKAVRARGEELISKE